MHHIDFGQAHHSTVIGTTGTGKTFGTAHSLLESDKGVFFFNTMGTDSVPAAYTRASGQSDIESIDRLLKRKRKVNFIPSFSPEVRDRQLQAIIRYLLDDGRKRDMILAVDEVHLFKNDKKAGIKVQDELIRLATTGRNFGVKGVYLSQRPANVNNNLLEMSSNWVIYFVPLGKSWFTAYNMPYEEIIEPLKSAPEHSYMLYDFKNVKGPFKVNV